MIGFNFYSHLELTQRLINKLFLFWGTEMNRITYAPYYSGLPVNTNWKKQEGSYIKILEIIH